MNAPTPKFCPHCGYDLVVDAPIMINGFSMAGAGRPLMLNGKRVELTRGEALICWSLMKAYPEPADIMILAERIGSEETKDPARTVMILVHRIRRKMKRDFGIEAPIGTIIGQHKYIWEPRA